MKGKREGERAFVDHWARPREGRVMSVTEFEREKRKNEEEEKEGGQKRKGERGERSRALSCRPGSQIRRGLKRGVDCV